MKVKVGISNRHIHLNKDDYNYLFSDIPFSKRNDLSQTGEFASLLTVTLKGPKGEINNVRVLGPLRSYTQVEVSKTDCYKLGVTAPVRDSGDLKDATPIEIIVGNKSITKNCLIIATRHIHINPDEQKRFDLYNDKVKVMVRGDKPTILEDVHLKVADTFKFELHLDTDDANCCLLNSGDEVEIIKY